MGKFRQISTELLPLIHVKLVLVFYLKHFFINFPQAHVNSYCEGELSLHII